MRLRKEVQEMPRKVTIEFETGLTLIIDEELDRVVVIPRMGQPVLLTIAETVKALTDAKTNRIS